MYPGSAERTRIQKSSPTSSLPNPPIKKGEADDREDAQNWKDAQDTQDAQDAQGAQDAQSGNTKDQSSINDDLELSDDEMDKDSGSSNSSNEAGCVLFGSSARFFIRFPVTLVLIL